MTELEQKIGIKILLDAYQKFLGFFPLKPCRSNEDYEKLMQSMNMIVDMGAADEKHELFDLYEIGLGLMSLWESDIVLAKVSPRELLKYLMDEHHLKQKDLADCASLSTISAFLNGKRGLSKEVAKKLAARFCVSVDAFLEGEEQ